MGRVEKFREIRLIRQKYIFSGIIFLTILAAGFCTADYSVNSLLNTHKGLKFFSVVSHESYMEVSFMNQKLEIDTSYINRDLKRLKDELSKLLQLS